MLKLLFILSVIAIPFNDFYPFLPLGEIKGELSVYLFFVTMAALVVFRSQLRQMTTLANLPVSGVAQPFSKLALIFFGVIAISFVMNFPAMLGESYHGRYPLEKFLTSTGVVGYGFALAYTTYLISRHYLWQGLIIRPITISVFICAAVATLEILAWTGGFFETLYTMIAKTIHLGHEVGESLSLSTKPQWLDIGRVRSICFEPPSLANFAGFAWPWAYAGTFSAPRKHKPIYVASWILCTALIFVANSRTSFVLLIGNAVALFLLKRVYLAVRPTSPSIRKATSVALITLAVFVVAAFFINTDNIADLAFKSDNVSNLTRFASVTAAFRMFFANPVWGFGFGQYGFHVLDYMPPWGFYSWEIKWWLAGNFVVWPPIFSVYARFAAELGILGVGAWVGIWVFLARTVWRVTFAYQMKTGQLLKMSYPIIMSCYCVLLSGIPLDGLRTPMMWITMGLACSFIYDVRSRLLKLTT